MALNNNRELYKKRVRKTLIYTFLVLLLIINSVTFCRHISSNQEELINYQRPFDELKDFRNPLIGVHFYNNKDETKITVLPVSIINHKNIKKQKLNFSDDVVVLDNAKTSAKHIKLMNKFSKNVSKTNFLQLDNNKHIVWFDDISTPLPEFSKIKEIVQEKSLKPKFFDLLNNRQIYNISKKKNKIKNTYRETL